jgi:hypothetical protein
MAVGRDDHGGRPAHHMVAAEQPVFPREAQVVGSVAGGVDGFDRRAADLDDLAIGEHPVGRIAGVEARFLIAGIASGAQPQTGAPCGRRVACARAMIAVSVGDQNSVDGPTGDRGLERIEVRRGGGSGSRMARRSVPIKCTPRTLAGEGRGIGREQAARPSQAAAGCRRVGHGRGDDRAAPARQLTR